MAFTGSIFGISGYFGTDDHTEVAEGFIQQFLIHFKVKITHKNIGSNILSPLILRSFVDFEWFSVKFDHMHDFYRVVSVFLALEFDEAVALMLIGDFISGDVDVDDWPALREQLPKHIFVDLLIDVSSVDCGLLVALVK